MVVKKAADGAFVVIDGYKRVRALRRLGRDTVGASGWPGEEAEALIATAVGLAAAIPAVVMYNRFSRQLRVLTAEMDTFASEFLNIAERHFLK